MKLLWLVFTLLPAPFLFHFYEYGQHIKQEDAPFLLIGSVAYIVVAGVLAQTISLRWVLLANVAVGILSVLLAMYFIPNDGGWFKPFNRDMVMTLTVIPFLIGQLLVRFMVNKLTLVLHSH